MPALLWLAPVPALAAALFAADGTLLELGNERLRLTFVLDRPGAVLLGVAAVLWIAAGAYAASFLRGRTDSGRFVVCWLMTLTGCVGVFLAADMVGFYFLLAVLSVGASALVIHDQTPQAWRAGAVYLGLALLAEAFLLGGFVLLAQAMPGGSLLIRDAAAALAGSPWRDLTLALLIAGFGMKAGLVPLHFWMPLAYEAAPIAGRGCAERRGGQGQHPRPDPLRAAGHGAAALGRSTRHRRIVRRAVRCRDRDHAGPSEGRAGVFERQPDGFHPRGHRHGNDWPGTRCGAARWRSTRRITCW